MLCRAMGVCAVLIAESLALMAQEEAAPPPRLTLKRVDAVELQLGTSGFFGSPICDSEGNIYLRTDAFLRLDKNPVWKISPQGKKLEEFAPPVDPDDSGKEFRLGRFTVSGRGDFYALTYDGNGAAEDYFLARYGSDGEVSSRVHLQLPPEFLADTVAVFATGDILISGHYSSRATATLRGTPRVLVLNSDGASAGEVNLTGRAADKVVEPSLGKKGSRSQGGTLPQEGVSMGGDGNAYLLRGPEVLVVSPHGELERTIPVPGPIQGFQATAIQVSHGVLSVTYHRVQFGKRQIMEVMFRTLDPSTGTVEAEYVPEPELSNASLCFSSGEGYTFFGKKNGRPALVRAWVH